MSWILDLVNPQERKWEEFYRNRWQHDQHRTQHARRQLHRRLLVGGLRKGRHHHVGDAADGLSAAGERSAAVRAARVPARHLGLLVRLQPDPREVSVYSRRRCSIFGAKRKASIPTRSRPGARSSKTKQKRKRYQRARGKGGFRRTKWDEVTELIAAASLYTARSVGPDRVMGFSPIPAMSFVSYAAGSRFLQLCGGVNMSFYDWYADLPNAFPEVWGDQTDVCESADWYNSKYIVSMAANLNMTRTPGRALHLGGAHRGHQVRRHRAGLQPGRQVLRRVDPGPGRTGHRAMDGGQSRHPQGVLRRPPRSRTSIDYLKHYTDSPFLVELIRRWARVIGRVSSARQSAGALRRRRDTATGRCW